MIFYPEGKELEVISKVFHGSVNDVYVCRDCRSAAGTLYTVLAVHDRECARNMLLVIENNERSGEMPCQFHFAQNETLLFVFPYRDERKFSTFSKGQVVDLSIGETIGINLTLECLSNGLPWPLLYLVLNQDCIQIAKDNTVYFNYTLDLKDLQPGLTEKNCVSSCAWILQDLLSAQIAGKRGKRRKQLKSFELIRKKAAKNSYTGFPELYHDIKLTALPAHKASVKGRFKGVWHRNKDGLFRLLLVLCGILLIIALIMLISQLIFGDVPLLRLIRNTFDVIGTQNLHKGGSI